MNSTLVVVGASYAVMGLAGDVGVVGGGSTKDANVGGSVYAAGSFGPSSTPAMR